MAPIGVAIIGGGIFVKEQHLPAVAKCDLLELKAIYSRSLKSAQETAALVKSGSSLDLYSADSGVGKTHHDLLLREDVQAVIIALPIVSQPEYIEAALAAGKHVLAEKPIAADVAKGKKLIDYYKGVAAEKSATLAIAENFRFFPSFTYAKEQGAQLGRVLHFSIKVFGLMAADNKYYNTSWRKTPEYQGGFLLDGGVHHAAAARLFLAGSSAAETVQAYTHQAQEHLPPIDSVDAIVKTKSGASGTFQISSGSNIKAFEWDIGYEKGSVKVSGDRVTVVPASGEQTVKDFEKTSAVTDEVAAWAKSIADGKPNPLQLPEEALADLEFLEKMFRSGEQNGAQQKYELQ